MKGTSHLLLASALVSVGSSTPSQTGPANQPTRTDYLRQHAPGVGPNLYSLGEGIGNVLLVEGCAYRVKTRLNLNGKTTTGPVQQSVAGSIVPYTESDGRRVCHADLKKNSARVRGESLGLWRLADHPFVINRGPDGCEEIMPGLYNPDTGGWSVSDITLAVPVTTPEGQPNCPGRFHVQR